MSMYKQFSTDSKAEKSGIIVDYGDFRVTVARAGGANKRYERLLESKSKFIDRARRTGNLSNSRAMSILKEVHAEAVVINWEVKDEEGNWIQGIEGPNGDVLPFTKDNIMMVFNMLEDLFQDIREQAENMALFKVAIREEKVEN